MYFLYDFVLTLFFRFCTLCIIYTKEEVMKLKIYREICLSLFQWYMDGPLV